MRWLAALLVAGCAHSPTLDIAEPHVGDEAGRVVDAWRADATLGPVPVECLEQLSRLRTVIVDNTSALCESVLMSDPYACLRQYKTGALGLGRVIPVVVMRRDEARPTLLMHELIHFVADCSNASGLENGDPAHADSRLWAATASVISRARQAPSE
jgi:hypothetical protein